MNMKKSRLRILSFGKHGYLKMERYIGRLK